MVSQSKKLEIENLTIKHLEKLEIEGVNLSKRVKSTHAYSNVALDFISWRSKVIEVFGVLLGKQGVTEKEDRSRLKRAFAGRGIDYSWHIVEDLRGVRRHEDREKMRKVILEYLNTLWEIGYPFIKNLEEAREREIKIGEVGTKFSPEVEEIVLVKPKRGDENHIKMIINKDYRNPFVIDTDRRTWATLLGVAAALDDGNPGIRYSYQSHREAKRYLNKKEGNQIYTRGGYKPGKEILVHKHGWLCPAEDIKIEYIASSTYTRRLNKQKKREKREN